MTLVVNGRRARFGTDPFSIACPRFASRVFTAREKFAPRGTGFFGRSFGIGRDGVVVVTSGCGAAVDLIDVSIEETRTEGRRMRDGGMGPFALCE